MQVGLPEARDEQARITFRCLDGAPPPRRITVEHPGWGGSAETRVNGSIAQPWHCAPFSEGASYGIELLYPFRTECHVLVERGKPVFRGEFENESCRSVVWPPFQTANPAHYSMATLLDIRVPEGYVLRVEPHSSYFTDGSGTVPAAVIGNLHSSWWPLCLFVTFKCPLPGQTHVFRRGQPYCQILAVPEKPLDVLEEMTSDEKADRERLAQTIMKGREKFRSRQWVARNGLRFDDVYKQMRRNFLAGGIEGLEDYLSGKP